MANHFKRFTFLCSSYSTISQPSPAIQSSQNLLRPPRSTFRPRNLLLDLDAQIPNYDLTIPKYNAPNPDNVEDVVHRAAVSQMVKSGQLKSMGEHHDRFVDMDRDAVSLALNPRPLNRTRWERRQIWKTVQRSNMPLSKREWIRLNEREVTLKSPWFKTSVKKLNLLARAIAGQPIDKAIRIMAQSKKKVATNVRQFLEYARQAAKVRYGMAGNVTPHSNLLNPSYKMEFDRTVTHLRHNSAARELEQRNKWRRGLIIDNFSRLDLNKISPITPLVVRDSHGVKRTITNLTSIYIAQAWVGRCTFTKQLEYRARGRVNILRMPYTTLSVLLKEEKTRIRETRERFVRLARRKVWVQMPDRPVTAQHQHILW